MSLASIAGSLASWFGRNSNTIQSVGSLVNPWNEQGIIGGVLSGKPVSESDSEILQAAKNFGYNFVGQTEKTSAYQVQMEREDSAYQRMAQDMAKAGLSKYFGGSPSSTGSYGDGVPKGLQFASALMSLKSAEAGIRKTNAEANLTDAQAVGQQNENRTFDESHSTQIANIVSQTRLNNARSQIAEVEGQYTAEKVTAEIDNLTKKSAQIVAETLYSQTQEDYLRGEYFWQDAEHQSQIASRESSIARNKAEIDNLRKSVQYVSEKIATEIVSRNNLSEQTKHVIAETAFKNLQTEIAMYDYEYSKSHGVRTSDATSRILGLNLDGIRENSGLSHENLLYKILFTPFWNWFEKNPE